MDVRSSVAPDFVVAYDGTAFADGRMPVRDLAPSLLALADLTQEANAVSADGAASVSLDIRAFDKASFEVWLGLSIGVGILNSDPVSAANNLITLTTGALDLIRRIRGRAVVSRTPLESGEIRIELSDRETIVAAKDALVLVERETFRDKARGFVLPLRNPGVDGLRVIVDGRPRLEIAAAEEEAFKEPPESGAVVESVNDVMWRLVVTEPSFIEGHKWRLSNGDHIDWYELRDERFFDRVNDRLEVFGSGDSLICRVQLEQLRMPMGEPRMRRIILEVLRHIPADEEPPLLIDPVDTRE